MNRFLDKFNLTARERVVMDVILANWTKRTYWCENRMNWKQDWDRLHCNSHQREVFASMASEKNGFKNTFESLTQKFPWFLRARVDWEAYYIDIPKLMEMWAETVAPSATPEPPDYVECLEAAGIV